MKTKTNTVKRKKAKHAGTHCLMPLSCRQTYAETCSIATEFGVLSSLSGVEWLDLPGEPAAEGALFSGSASGRRWTQGRFAARIGDEGAGHRECAEAFPAECVSVLVKSWSGVNVDSFAVTSEVTDDMCEDAWWEPRESALRGKTCGVNTAAVPRADCWLLS